tara:strand:+ start:1610 stop:1882 length:273 start_codon:yes stop_codon:yes gene_type:complete
MSDQEENPFGWLKHVTGPAGALVVAVFGIYFLGQFIDKMAERHFEVVDRVVDENKEAREEQTKNMIKLTQNVSELSKQVEKMKECCQAKE